MLQWNNYINGWMVKEILNAPNSTQLELIYSHENMKATAAAKPNCDPGMTSTPKDPVPRSQQPLKSVSKEEAPLLQLNTHPLLKIIYTTQLKWVSMGKSSAQDGMKALFSIELNEDRCQRQWETQVKSCFLHYH